MNFQRRQRIGLKLARLLDGAPFANHEAALQHILDPEHWRPRDRARWTLSLALRRNLLVRLDDGRIVRPYNPTPPPTRP